MEKKERRELDFMLDQEDVSRLLKVSTKTLEYWRCQGIGPNFVKVGKLVRYRMSDLNEFIRELVEKQHRKSMELHQQQ